MFGFIDYCADHQLAGTELTSYFFPKDLDDAYLLRIKQHAFLRGIAISGTGGELADTQVNAITGATITCDKLQAIINVALTVILEEDQQGGK